MTTPSMRLSGLMLKFPGQTDIHAALEEAFALGHEFGRDRAADEVDRLNRKGPYEAIGAAAHIRKLRVMRPTKDQPPTIDEDLFP